MLPTQYCNKCWQEKPLEDFYVDKQNKNGRTKACKNCTKELANRSWAQKRRNVLKTISTWAKGLGYQCSECKNWWDDAKVFQIVAKTDRGQSFKDEFTHAQLYAHILKRPGQASTDFRSVCLNCTTTLGLTKSQQPNGE